MKYSMYSVTVITHEYSWVLMYFQWLASHMNHLQMKWVELSLECESWPWRHEYSWNKSRVDSSHDSCPCLIQCRPVWSLARMKVTAAYDFLLIGLVRVFKYNLDTANSSSWNSSKFGNIYIGRNSIYIPVRPTLSAVSQLTQQQCQIVHHLMVRLWQYPLNQHPPPIALVKIWMNDIYQHDWRVVPV